MSFWIMLWKVCLVGSLVVFSVMSVCVIIGGARDVFRLLDQLRKEQGK